MKNLNKDELRNLIIAITLIVIAMGLLIINIGKLNKKSVQEIENVEETVIDTETEDITIEETEGTTDNIELETVEIEETAEIEEEIPVEPKEVTLSFAGDCTLGEFKGQGAGNQFKDFYNEYGPEFFLEDVKSVFEKDDLTIVNLEGPLTEKVQTAQKTYPIKGDPENVKVLTSSSVELVNLANNHIYDCGEQGFEDTKQLLSENNIGFFGENEVDIREVNGIKLGFIGYRGWDISDTMLNKIKSDIENLKNEENAVDVVVVFFHYGEERHYESNSAQEKISRHTIDCGADIVIGGHPHVIQGIEVYNGKTICYSMGNFSFGANKNPSDKDTFIYQQTFRLNEDGTIEYTNHNIIPCSISSEKNRNTYRPTLLTGEDSERVINRLKEYSSKYEVSIFDIKQ